MQMLIFVLPFYAHKLSCWAEWNCSYT